MAIDTETISQLGSPDFETLYNQQKEENARLQASMDAAAPRQSSHSSSRPSITAEEGIARLIREGGSIGFLNASRAQKLAVIGITDPNSVDDDLLHRGWGRGIDGTVGKDLMQANEPRHHRLKAAAKILNIFGQPKKQQTSTCTHGLQSMRGWPLAIQSSQPFQLTSLDTSQ